MGSEPSPLTLGCRILFTTRQRDLGRFHAVEVSVLPEGPALQLLLRHESRHAVRDNPDHPERHEAQAICRLLGWLPLALELAGAFLGKRSAVPLADYRRRLQAEGCLSTLDSEVKHLPRIYFQPIHEAAVAATLKTQWDVLTQDRDEEAQLLFRVAGQFPEAAVHSHGDARALRRGAHSPRPATFPPWNGPWTACMTSGSSRNSTPTASACTPWSGSSPRG